MISASVLRDAIISGSNNIVKHKSVVDKLNIFPVPDGDTGTNMSMTMTAGAKELTNAEFDTAGKVAEVTASALLRGARGNSGVILSLLFRGFSRGLKGLSEASGADLAEALSLGVEAAYKAVMKPTEGTMLTVSRVAAERGKYAATVNNDALYVWEAICEGAAQSLETTPELLPVLKKAGVVDAGGMGLCHIFEGMMSVFRDGVIIEGVAKTVSDEGDDDFFANAAAEFDDDITFTYCTEYIVGRDPDCARDPLELRAYLETIGDCVVVVDDEEIIKVHVHTESPGLALQEALTFGQLITVKVENMKEQHKEQGRQNDAANAKQAKKAPKKLEKAEPEEEFGFVAVAAGDGLETLFTDLGCLHVVTGGQTMNPSTEDILEACLATPAKIVFVLPNNKNIIMAAEQAEALCDDRKIVVVPTRTLPQGIAAMLAFNPDISSEENHTAMMDAAGRVGTGQVTFAARDSEFGGMKMKEGEIIALENGKLVFSEKDCIKAVVRLARSMVNRETEFLTLIYGEDVSEAQAMEAKSLLSAKLGSAVDITVISGGQPVYYFILSVE